MRHYDMKPQTITHCMAHMAHQVAMWANISIIRQIFPHHFEESMQVLVIISYIIKKRLPPINGEISQNSSQCPLRILSSVPP